MPRKPKNPPAAQQLKVATAEAVDRIAALHAEKGRAPLEELIDREPK